MGAQQLMPDNASAVQVSFRGEAHSIDLNGVQNIGQLGQRLALLLNVDAISIKLLGSKRRGAIVPHQTPDQSCEQAGGRGASMR